MKIEADAKLVTIYVNSTDQWHGQSLYAAIVALCKDRVSLASRLCDAQRATAAATYYTTRLLELSENLPMRVEIVDISERIEPLLPALEPMIGEGLLTITNVHIRRYLHDPKN